MTNDGKDLNNVDSWDMLVPRESVPSGTYSNHLLPIVPTTYRQLLIMIYDNTFEV